MSNMVSYADLPPDAVIVCPACGAKNARTDDLCNRCDAPLNDAKLALMNANRAQMDARLAPTKERGKLAREVTQRHPGLKEKVLGRLSMTSLPWDDYPVADDAMKDISYWDEKATVAGNFEKAGRFEESARHYEDIGLWSDAGRARSKISQVNREQVVREREIVLIKCSYYGSLNPQGTLKCSSCGGRI